MEQARKMAFRCADRIFSSLNGMTVIKQIVHPLKITTA